MARPRARKEVVVEDLGPSILQILAEEHAEKLAEEEFQGYDMTALFCGMKKSGKTCLVDRIINPTREDKVQPKPTVALEYKFARYAPPSSSQNIIAHIYDMSDDKCEALLGIPCSVHTIGKLAVVLVVDLSEPHNVFPSLAKWINILQERIEHSVEALANDANIPGAAKRAQWLRACAAEQYADCADAGRVTPFPVPFVIVASKCDTLSELVTQQRQAMARGLRYFAHAYGGHLVYTSLEDKAAMKTIQGLLRQLLFGVTAKGLVEQVDPMKPVYMPPGRDSLAELQFESAAMVLDHMAALFPDPQPLKRGEVRLSEAELLGEELARYPEAQVDGVVEQRTDELAQYRRQVERNKRLASQGVDGSKLTSY